MTEKRKHQRVREEDGIAVRTLSKDGAEEELTILRMTKDISKFGLKFQTEYHLPEDTRLKIYMALKSPRKTITHFARVAWSKKMEDEDNYTVGVELIDASDGDMELWDSYIESRVEETE